jgi:hypothetical protein
VTFYFYRPSGHPKKSATEMEDASDPTMANILLAEYEKFRAAEMMSYAERIDCAEYQQYLLTFGHPALTRFADELAEHERYLQLVYDLSVIAACRREFPHTAEQSLRAYDAYASQRLLFKHVTVSKALADVEAKTRQLRDENLRLNMISAVPKSVRVTPPSLALQPRVHDLV